MPWGNLTGFFEFQGLPSSSTSRCQALLLLGFAFFIPAFPEEIWFRGCLIRQPCVQEDQYLAIGTVCSKRPPVKEQIANIAIFVFYHLGIGHEQPAYRSPQFLVLLVFAAWTFQEVLIRTESLWPSVLLHWIEVWIWVSFLGGGEKLAIDGNASLAHGQNSFRNSICN